MTPRSSRSARAVGPAVAPAPSLRRPPAAWRRARRRRPRPPPPSRPPTATSHCLHPSPRRPRPRTVLVVRAGRRPAHPRPACRGESGSTAGDHAPPKVDPVPSGLATSTSTRERHPLRSIPTADWLAAFQHAALEVFGDQWEPRLAEFLAFLRRRITGDYVVDEYGFDAEITQRFFMAALRPIAQQWFRIDVRGVENIPAEGGALVVSNHSGTVPVDGLMTMVSIHDHTGRHLRALGADLVFRMPIISSMARKGGATLACSEDAERMLRAGELVGVWPEGFKGIGKPFSQRYKLQRFGRGGFVSAALRTGVPIVPLAVVGAEEIYPLVGNIPALARLIGVPYLPITPALPAPGTARPDPAAVQVAAGVRRADPHRRVRRRRGRRPDAGLRRHRPGARDHPADALLTAGAAHVRLRLTRTRRARPRGTGREMTASGTGEGPVVLSSCRARRGRRGCRPRRRAPRRCR